MHMHPAVCLTFCVTLTFYCLISLPVRFVKAAPMLEETEVLDSLEDNIAICVVACARCHDTLGTIFDHIKCTRQCVRHRGITIPDCHSAKTVRKYLKQEFIEQYL